MVENIQCIICISYIVIVQIKKIKIKANKLNLCLDRLVATFNYYNIGNTIFALFIQTLRVGISMCKLCKPNSVENSKKSAKSIETRSIVCVTSYSIRSIILTPIFLS